MREGSVPKVRANFSVPPKKEGESYFYLYPQTEVDHRGEELTKYVGGVSRPSGGSRVDRSKGPSSFLRREGENGTK